MDPQLITNIPTILASLAFLLSIYAVWKVSRKKKIVTPIEETPVSIQIAIPDVVPTETPKIETEPKVEIEIPKIEPETPKVENETPKVEKKVEKKKSLNNNWNLEITGIKGAKFSIKIEWSDGTSSNIIDNISPIELKFVHPKGIMPVKVIGIPPHGDREISYLWKLNSFHWS